VPRLAAAPSRTGFPHHYFDHFLPRWLGQPLLPGVTGVTVTFTVALTAPETFRRTVVIEDGRLRAIHVESALQDCTYTLDEGVLRRITAGRLDPRDAFFARRTQIEGDIEAGLRVASLMIDFFRRNPLTEIPDHAAKRLPGPSVSTGDRAGAAA
jgi:putative sterol carrier protein